MSKLNELIEKTIIDLRMKGCSRHPDFIKMQLETIVSLAKLEESIESNQRFIDSLPSAFGSGANDKVDRIGDLITEPSLTPEQLVRGEWYVISNNTYSWIFRFESYNIFRQHIHYTLMKNILPEFPIIHNDYLWFENGDVIRPATKQEVLKYFPDETFGDSDLNFINHE